MAGENHDVFIGIFVKCVEKDYDFEVTPFEFKVTV